MYKESQRNIASIILPPLLFLQSLGQEFCTKIRVNSLPQTSIKQNEGSSNKLNSYSQPQEYSL
jgi:hypothetical protein